MVLSPLSVFNPLLKQYYWVDQMQTFLLDLVADITWIKKKPHTQRKLYLKVYSLGKKHLLSRSHFYALPMPRTANKDCWNMLNMGFLLTGTGSEDRVSGWPELLLTIEHLFVKGRVTLQVCIVNWANVFCLSVCLFYIDSLWETSLFTGFGRTQLYWTPSFPL